MNISFFLSLGHLQLPNNKPACTQNRHTLGPVALVAISEVKNVLPLIFTESTNIKNRAVQNRQLTNKQKHRPTNKLCQNFWRGMPVITCKIPRDNAFILHDFQSGLRRHFYTETALIQLMDQILFDLNIDKVLVLSLLITKRYLMSSTITCYSQSLSL